MDQIPDDPTVIKPILQEVSQNFKSGGTKSIQYRRQQIRSLIQGLKEMESEFNEAHKKDLGYSEFSTYLLSAGVIIIGLEHLEQSVSSWSKQRRVETPVMFMPGKSYLKPEPYGVALVIGSWNYPLNTLIGPAATAIAAGNAVILKPSELAPNCSILVAKLFERYLDQRYYRVIQGQVEVAKEICKQPFDIIIFTGSTEKGKLVAKAAADNLVPCILELGGKSPTIVDEDANIDSAAKKIVFGRYTNAGQTCVAPDYVLVHSRVKQNLLEKMKSYIKEFYSENPEQSSNYFRIVTEFHTKRLLGLLQNTGGTIVVGGNGDVTKKYIEPTIVDQPNVDSAVMQEEIFGPILPVLAYNSIEEVVQFVNERPKPLALYYFGVQNLKEIENRTSSGGFVVNEAITQFIHANLPFGGVGHSGYGVTHGILGFDAVSHLKPVYIKYSSNYPPFTWSLPPFNGFRQKFLKFFIGNSYAPSQSTLVNGSLILLALLAFAISYKLGYTNQIVDSTVDTVRGLATGKKSEL